MLDKESVISKVIIDSVELSQELMKCPSVTPEEAGALSLLETKLKLLGFKCYRKTFDDKDTPPVDNLYARIGSEGKNICFAGHTDVVPVGDFNAWKFDPFSATIDEGVLYGRGAVDMKAAIACFVAATSRFLSERDTNEKGSISFLITADEEGPAINGTRKMLDWIVEQGEKIDACIVGEPTNPKKLGDMVKIGRRGSVTFYLTVRGVQGHVAYPDIADNPTANLIKILSILKNEHLDDGNEFFQPSNLEITTIDVGNTADNVIPSEAKATINIRFNTTYSSKDLIKKVDDICNNSGANYNLDYRVTGDAFITKAGVLSDIVKNSVKKITNREPELSTSGGTSDARFIKNICPVVECGLINETAHKVDECIDVADIISLTDIYKDILDNYL